LRCSRHATPRRRGSLRGSTKSSGNDRGARGGASPIRELVGLLAYGLLFGALLFGGAGTWHWPSGWALLGTVLAVGGLSSLRLLALQPQLLAERAKGPLQDGQPLTDRLLLGGFMATFAGLIAFAGADVWRLHLLAPLPSWTRVVGLVAFVVGRWIVYRALRANAFAVTVVRVQDERRHRVVRDGPYRLVRHPMYAGMVPAMAGMGLWLHSTAATLAAAIPTAFLVARIVLEERLLSARLPDYAQYTSAVRWRLLRGVW
jgi:protein-S-isoprenylcysteine O-methyltransferase Ste14